MVKFCAISLLLSIAALPTFGQCKLTMPTSDTICNFNQGVTLGPPSGGAFGYNWTPNEGLSASDKPNPVANPTQTQTYKVTANIFIGKELVINGNFDKGNTGFSSQYSFLNNPSASSGNFSTGMYAIAVTSKDKHPCFSSCADYSSGKGNMMIVNGAETSNRVVWEQTIIVDTSYNYALSTFAQNISCNSNAPAVLQFAINDSLIGPAFEVSSTLCLWERFYCLWNSKTDTVAKISIVNKSIQVKGNDFALDSISFRKYCKASEEVEVIVNAEKVYKAIKTCAGDNVLLNGNYYSTDTSLKFSLKNKKGCDSLVTVDLTFEPVIRTFPYLSKCEGDSIFLENKFRKTTGRYTDTLKTIKGCDSITKTFLVFIPRNDKTVEASPCFNTSFYYKNIAYKVNGIYYDTVYKDGCIDTVTQITITPYPEKKTILPITQFCKGDSSLYKNTFVSRDTIIYDTLTANTGCDSLVVYHYKTFNNYFDVDSVVLFCGDIPAKFDAGGNYNSYQWSNGLTTKNIETSEEGKLTISVIDSNQCLMHDTVYFIERCKPIFFVPNAFTVNGDGLNDYFSIYTKNVIDLKFMIIDRWGEVLFETDKVDFVWNGTYKSKALPEGLYQWVGTFKGYTLEGQIITENRKGYIKLLR